MDAGSSFRKQRESLHDDFIHGKQDPYHGSLSFKEEAMPDSTTQTAAPDRIRINVNESWEVDYWTRKFGVEPQSLKDAVSKVGPMVEDVQRHLGKSGKR
jgi:hypothetical protein